MKTSLAASYYATIAIDSIVYSYTLKGLATNENEKQVYLPHNYYYYTTV